MTRRRFASLLVVALLAWAGLRAPVWSARMLARELTLWFHRPVTVRAVVWHALPLEAEILDLRIAGPTAGTLPFAEVPRLRVVPAVRPLWNGRIALWRVLVERPRVRVHTYPNGGDDIPALGGAGGPGGGLDVHRLTVEGGELLLDDRRIPLDLDLPGFRGSLAVREAGVLAGDVAFGPGPARFGDAPELPVEASARVSLAGGVLTLESARLRSEGTDLSFAGSVALTPRLEARLAGGGTLPLEMADRHVLRTGLGLRGAARYDGSVVVSDGRLRVAGRLQGTAGAFDGIDVPRFDGHVLWDEQRLRIRGLEVAAMGGSASFDVTVPAAAGGEVAVAGSVRGVDAESLARYVLATGPLGIAASASGPVSVRWPRGAPARVSGTARLALRESADPRRTPLSGTVDWSAEDGVQRLGPTDLLTPVAHVAVAGRIGRARDVALSLQAEAGDLTAAEALSARLRRAFGGHPAEPLGVTGSGRFQGRWAGTLDAPLFEGRFEGKDIRYAGADWGEVDWTGRTDGTLVESQPLIVRRDAGQIRVTGRTRAGAAPGDLQLDVHATLSGWPAEDLDRAMAAGTGLRGRVSGEVTLRGTRAAPTGSAHLSVPEAARGAASVRDLVADLLLHEGSAEIQSVRAQAGGGALVVTGSVRRDGALDLQAEVRDVDAAALLPALQPDAAWGGRLSGSARIRGTRESPAVEAHVVSRRLFLADEGVGALDLRIGGASAGGLAVAASLLSPRVDLKATGTLSAAAPYTGRLRVEAHDTSLDPFLRVLAPALPESVGLVASGAVDIAGDFAAPEALSVSVLLPSLQVRLPEYPVANAAPVRGELEGGTLRVQELHLAGEGTDLRVTGEVRTGRDAALALDVRGDADLRALGAVTRRLRGQGAARLSMTVAGAPRDPRVDGTLQVTNGGLRVRGFPHGVDSLAGTLRFSERAARFEDVHGAVGGGDVDLDGQAAYTGARLQSFEVRASGRSMALRYPEGLRSVVDAELRVFGDAARQWATGTVDVHQAVWTRRYDVATELLASRAAWVQPVSLEEGVHLDVKVSAPGTLRVDNNLATLQARADLQLRGTSAAPVVLGRAEVERGRVYFQGNTYVIRRGTIDFLNPQRIDPLFDIEAETRLRSYRVTLKANGTLDRVYPTLSSDPPLNAVQIVSLLAGGDETTVSSLAHPGGSQGAASSSGANLAATGAATLAAGRISEQVGLERGAEKLFGLNRFSIDPSLVKGGVQNPTARLTLGKRVTPDLNVLYSVDLRGTDERLLSVEYTLSDRLSVLMTRAEPGGLGFDLRLRQSR